MRQKTQNWVTRSKEISTTEVFIYIAIIPQKSTMWQGLPMERWNFIAVFFFSISVFLNKQNNTDLTQRRWREPKSDSKCPLRSLGSALGLLCKQKKKNHVRLPHVSPSSPKVCLLNWSVLFWCSLYPFTNEAKRIFFKRKIYVNITSTFFWYEVLKHTFCLPKFHEILKINAAFKIMNRYEA